MKYVVYTKRGCVYQEFKKLKDAKEFLKMSKEFDRLNGFKNTWVIEKR